MNATRRRGVPSIIVVLAGLALLAGAAQGADEKATPQVVPPQPTVPEIFTLMGQYVRVAYNNQGFATLGYRAAQQSVGTEWLLLEVGLTVRQGAKDATLTRDAFSLQTPDGKRIALATQKEYLGANLKALNMRAGAIRDSINYFPVDVTRRCALQLFADLDQRRMAYDQVELSSSRACTGRLYFDVAGGIQVGQHWLHVNFPESELQVPFRILTKDEEKEFKNTWEDVKKAHEESLK